MIEAIIEFGTKNNRKKNEQKKSLFEQFAKLIFCILPTAKI